MAKRIETTDLIDIPGYKEAIIDAQRTYKAFADSSIQQTDELKKAITAAVAEITQLRNLNASGGLNSGQQAEAVERGRQLKQQLTDQRSAVEALVKVQQQQQQTTEALIAKQNQLIAQHYNLTGTTGRETSTRQRLTKEIVANQIQLDRLAKSQKQNTDAAREVTGQYNTLQRELADARKALKNLSDGFDQNTGKINQNNAEAVRLGRVIQQNDALLKKFDATMGSYTRSVGNYPKVMGGLAGSVNGAIGSLTRMTVGYITLNEVVSQSKAMITATTQAESLSAAMQAVHTSAQQAAESEQFIYQQSDRLGAEINSVSQSFTTLAGATRGSALEGDGTRRIWNAIVTAGTGMKRTNEEIQRAVVATGQVFSKQKVQAEELSGQLAEALPGSLQILSKEMGVSTRQLLKMAADGELLALDVLPKLAAGLEKTYSKSVADNADNLASNTNRLTNVIQALRKVLFEETGAKSWFSGFLKDEIAEIKDWIYLFKNFKALRGEFFTGELAGNALRERRTAADNKASTYSSFSQLSSTEMLRTINLQEQSDMTVEQANHVVRLKAIYAKRIADEKKLAEETSKQRYELGEQQREKDRKKREAAAKKEANERKREAEAALRDNLGKASAGTAEQLGQSQQNFESGLITEQQYIVERLRITTEGITKRRALLHKAGKDETDDMARLNAEQSKANADYLKAKNDLQERAFRDALGKTKDALTSDQRLIESGLQDRLVVLENAYNQAESAVKIAVTRRQITEGEGETRIHDLKLTYLEDIQRATLSAADTVEQRAKDRIAMLRAQGKTEEQIAQALALEKEAIDKADAERKDATAKRDKDRSKDDADYRIKQEERVARKKQELIDLSGQVALQGVQTFSEIATGFRDAEIAALEKQKEYELTLVGDNAEAKAAIEKRYDQQSREIKRRQAIADKTAAVFSIAINTAVAASKVLAEPFLLPLTLALGALQLAAVIAKPIPEFFKGTRDAPEGPAWVGERGYELIESKQGGKSQYRLAAEKQITYLNKHDRVYTHEETKRMLRTNSEIVQDVRSAPGGSLYVPPIINSGMDESTMLRVMRQVFSEMTWEKTSFDENGVRRYTEKQNNRTEWLNNRMNYPKRNG